MSDIDPTLWHEDGVEYSGPAAVLLGCGLLALLGVVTVTETVARKSAWVHDLMQIHDTEMSKR